MKSSSELVFYVETQWDDQVLDDSQLTFKGEFNMIRKAGNQILAQLQENPIRPDFQPINETSDDAAELMDGMYRKDSHDNASIESFQNAATEAVICGIGAWKLINEYETSRAGETKQVIRREPIYEANNNLFWDNNAKRVDKSDARRCTHLHAYSIDAYREMVSDIKGIDPEDVEVNSFAQPEQSYTFPWYNNDAVVYVGEYYYREKVKTRSYIVEDIWKNTMVVDAQKVDDNPEEFKSSGNRIIDEREYDRFQVTCILASGSEIIEETILPGEYIPIITQYGYRFIVEGQECYEGVTRLAMDPQRLRNFQLSYLADIYSRSPRQKAIFGAEQMQGHEHMYEINGADNNYPYVIQNLFDPNGNPLPLGPVGVTPEQKAPDALIQALPLTEKAIEDVANPGLPQDIADPDASGKAVLAVQERMDRQTSEYLNKSKFSFRWDAVVYASMSVDVYDVPRTVIVELPNGEREEVEVMATVLDDEMNPVIVNDLSNAEFEVYAAITQEYGSQKQKTKEELMGLMGMMQPNDPLREAMMLSYASLVDGDSVKDIREYSNKQLLLRGIREPESKEDFEFLKQQSEKEQEPSAEMVLAQAEQGKAQSDIMNSQTKVKEAEIKEFEAITRRQEVMVKAKEAGAKIDNTNTDTSGKRIDNYMKLKGSATQSTQSP